MAIGARSNLAHHATATQPHAGPVAVPCADTRRAANVLGSSGTAPAVMVPARGHLSTDMPFLFESLSIPSVVLVRRTVNRDDRGTFTESYKRSEFFAAGVDAEFVQDNVVSSRKNVLRGLHYQLPPSAQGKLVSVLGGEVLDIAVDLRRDSHSFGGWVGHTLTARGGEMLWVPAGFAHGYLVLSETALVMYKVTSEYRAEDGRGIRWNDADIGIEWPCTDPILSERDRDLPSFRQADNPF